jgi:hypothetical protein
VPAGGPCRGSCQLCLLATPCDESYEDFSYSTKQAAILLTKDLIKILFSPPMNNDSPAKIPDFLESTPTPTTSSLAMELQSSIEYVSSVRPTARLDTFTELQKEFKLVLGHQYSRNCCRHFSQFSQLQRTVKECFQLLVVFPHRSEIG